MRHRPGVLHKIFIQNGCGARTGYLAGRELLRYLYIPCLPDCPDGVSSGIGSGCECRDKCPGKPADVVDYPIDVEGDPGAPRTWCPRVNATYIVVKVIQEVSACQIPLDKVAYPCGTAAGAICIVSRRHAHPHILGRVAAIVVALDRYTGGHNILRRGRMPCRFPRAGLLCGQAPADCHPQKHQNQP